MECAGVRDRLSWYLDAELDEGTLEAVECHLARCPECRRELDALRALVQASAGIELVEPPSDLKSAIVKASRRADQCSPILDLLSAYVDGELNPAESHRVESHLNECKFCSEDAAALGRLVAAASEVVPVEPPTDLRERIRSATTTGRPERLPLAGLWRMRGFRWAGGAVAAAAGAAVVLAVILSGPQVRKPEPIRADQTVPRVAGRPTAPPIAGVVTPEPVSPTVGTVPGVGITRVRVTPRPIVVSRSVPTAHATKPVKPSTSKPAKPEVDTVEVVEPTVTEVSEAESEEMAEAPKPAPTIKSEEHKQVRPALTKVASAPAASTDDTEAFIQHVKTSAAMKNRGGSSGIQLFSTRF